MIRGAAVPTEAGVGKRSALWGVSVTAGAAEEPRGAGAVGAVGDDV